METLQIRINGRIYRGNLTSEICKKYPQVKVLFYGPGSDVKTVKKVMSAGAHGYIWEEEPKITVIREVMKGKSKAFPNTQEF